MDLLAILGFILAAMTVGCTAGALALADDYPITSTLLGAGALLSAIALGLCMGAARCNLRLQLC